MLSFQPVISPWLAGLSCVLFTIVFVGSLFVFPIHDNINGSSSSASTAPGSPDNRKQRLDRDHPLVIQQRIKGIALTCVLVPLYLWGLFTYSGALPSHQPLSTRINLYFQLLGIAFPTSILRWLNQILLPLVLVAILFLGPLMMMFLRRELPFQSRFSWKELWHTHWNWIGLRNYVVGPIAEEFIFRACMVPLTAFSGASIYAMIFGLPLVFGIAHLHHGYESYVKKGRTRQVLIQAIVVTMVQLTYTTLFGWFATFLFLRTSSLLSVCLAHSFCNVMGFPDVSTVKYYGHWQKWIWVGFIMGAVLFSVGLRPLTEPVLFGDASGSAYWAMMTGVRTGA